jgi:hypothetical protein
MIMGTAFMPHMMRELMMACERAIENHRVVIIDTLPTDKRFKIEDIHDVMDKMAAKVQPEIIEEKERHQPWKQRRNQRKPYF